MSSNSHVQIPRQARLDFEAWRKDLSINFFEQDSHLHSLLKHHEREEARAALVDFGQRCLQMDVLAHENNREEHLPRLRSWNDQGHRVEHIDFHESYHQIGRLLYGAGVMSRYAQKGREFETLAMVYMSGQNGEAGHNCPLACTAGLIKTLQGHGDSFQTWLDRLQDPNYDTHFHGSQFLTEVQGGSDVGANALLAEPTDQKGWSRLYGEKWFCSVVDAQLMLVTARPIEAPDGTKGVRAFVVPRHLENGQLNAFKIRRLKFKLGTKSMASGEIDFEGALAAEVGDFKDTVNVVLNTSRLYNAVVGAGLVQRAYREAHAYARHRSAFGQPILQFPMLARIIARLRTEAYAARGLTFLLAALSDRMSLGQADDTEQNAFRMLVNLNKFWVSYVGTACTRDAIEVLGGNGAIEEFSVLPRLLRDSIVCEQWEGPHNVLCLQVLRDGLQRGLDLPMFEYLQRLVGPQDPDFLKAKELWQSLKQMDQEKALLHARDVMEALRPFVQAMALSAEAKTPGSDPLLPTVIEHLRHIQTNPLQDEGLAQRVARLVL